MTTAKSRVLRLLLLPVLVVPGSIAVWATILSGINAYSGYLRVLLWSPLATLFVAFGLASPIVGIATFIVALADKKMEEKEKRLIVSLSLAAILLILLWMPVAFYMIFLLPEAQDNPQSIS